MAIHKRYTTLFFVLVLIWQIKNIQADEWENRVYLATYPRSGNHWARHLIEDATHISTSSVYRDQGDAHLATPFPWGGYAPKNGYAGDCRYVNNGEPVVIKTHYPALSASPYDKKPYKKVIHIVRNPVDSIYSYYAFKKKDKVEKVIPEKILEQLIHKYDKFEKYWALQRNVFTIRYEEMLKNPRMSLKKILDAIGYKVASKDIHHAVKKNPPLGEPLKHLSKFTPKQLRLIDKKLGWIMYRYGYKIPKEAMTDPKRTTAKKR